MKYNYGNVYYVDFKGRDCQIKGIHPAIVVSNDIGNTFSPNLQVIPISSAKKRPMPTHVFLSSRISGLPKDCYAQCESMTMISKSDVLGFICELPDNYRKDIARASAISTPLLCELSVSELLSLVFDLNQKSLTIS